MQAQGLHPTTSAVMLFIFLLYNHLMIALLRQERTDETANLNPTLDGNGTAPIYNKIMKDCTFLKSVAGSNSLNQCV